MQHGNVGYSKSFDSLICRQTVEEGEKESERARDKQRARAENPDSR